MDPDVHAVIAQRLHIIQAALHRALQVSRGGSNDLVIAQNGLLLAVCAVPVIIDTENITVLSHQAVKLAVIGFSVVSKDKVAIAIHRGAMGIGNCAVTCRFPRGSLRGHDLHRRNRRAAKGRKNQYYADNAKEHSLGQSHFDSPFY